MTSPLQANSLTLPSPAKINLFLHITGQRENGYHELQTVFQLLDYNDELTFTPRSDALVTLSPSFPEVSTDHNLIIRAAKLLQQQSQTTHGADIHCSKRLPMGAGLGGGSSNAATTLIALNKLWDLNLSIEALMELGLELGADVPVFVRGHSAWAEGIGDQLQAIELPENWYLIVIPPCAVSTAEIFKAEDLTRNTSPITIAAFLEGRGHNDCQTVVEKRHPEVKKALDWLEQFAPCQMTGTGSAIFARFSSEQKASEPLAKLPAELKGFVARGVNHSPLLKAINP